MYIYTSMALSINVLSHTTHSLLKLILFTLIIIIISGTCMTLNDAVCVCTVCHGDQIMMITKLLS